MPQRLDSPLCHQNWVWLALDILLEMYFKLMNSPRPLAYSLLWQQVVGISASSLNSIPKTHRTQTDLSYFSSNKQDSFLDLEQFHFWNEHTLAHLYTHTFTLALSPIAHYEEPACFWHFQRETDFVSSVVTCLPEFQACWNKKLWYYQKLFLCYKLFLS